MGRKTRTRPRDWAVAGAALSGRDSRTWCLQAQAGSSVVLTTLHTSLLPCFYGWELAFAVGPCRGSLRIAVLVNEVGQVDVDSELVNAKQVTI